MSQLRQWQRLGAAAVLAMSGASLAGEKDDPNARKRAMDEWYNESYAKPHGKGLRKGGPWSPSFRKFMNDAAAKERAKYGSLLPGTSTTITASGLPTS